jgi:hypothetical protein
MAARGGARVHPPRRQGRHGADLLPSPAALPHLSRSRNKSRDPDAARHAPEPARKDRGCAGTRGPDPVSGQNTGDEKRREGRPRAVRALLGDFMDGAKCEPAAGQHGIDRVDPERQGFALVNAVRMRPRQQASQFRNRHLRAGRDHP